MPTASTRPYKITYWNTTLSVSTRKVVGWHAYCACGWIGDTHKQRGDAHDDELSHRAEHILSARRETGQR